MRPIFFLFFWLLTSKTCGMWCIGFKILRTQYASSLLRTFECIKFFVFHCQCFRMAESECSDEIGVIYKNYIKLITADMKNYLYFWSAIVWNMMSKHKKKTFFHIRTMIFWKCQMMTKIYFLPVKIDMFFTNCKQQFWVKLTGELCVFLREFSAFLSSLKVSSNLPRALKYWHNIKLLSVIINVEIIERRRTKIYLLYLICFQSDQIKSFCRKMLMQQLVGTTQAIQ